MRRDLHICWVIALGLVAASAGAVPITPKQDDEVVETLPAAAGGSRSEERQWRRELAQRPRDARLAVGLARRYLEQARAVGDGRPRRGYCVGRTESRVCKLASMTA